MEWNMLKETKKLFPHWLDKSENSNFSKHLSIINNQQKDMMHKMKCVDWSRLLNKPLQIHKTQTEPYKWKMEFEVNVPRLKQVNIYKNPTIVDNTVVNSKDVTNGYIHDNSFFKNCNTVITDENIINVENDGTSSLSDMSHIYEYSDEIICENEKYYCDLSTNKYYKYINNSFKAVDENEIPQTSLIYSTSFIDNHSHFFRHIIYDEITNPITINQLVLDNDKTQKYKTLLNYNENISDFSSEIIDNILEDNGIYELTICPSDKDYTICYNISSGKYIISENGKIKELENNDIEFINHKIQYKYSVESDEEGNAFKIIDGYYYTKNDETIDLVFDGENKKYYIFTDIEEIDNDLLVEDNSVLKIPLVETEDITPLISNDRYVLEVFTWNDYHFMKGFPEIDYIDTNGNKIIDNEERYYNDLNIEIEKINNEEYLTFRVHHQNIKLIEVFKDEEPIHIADFLVEDLMSNNFAHIYNYNDNKVYYPYESDDVVEEANLDVDEYVWRLKISDEDKIFDENGNYELKNDYLLKVTYFDSRYPYVSDYDMILTKKYVCEESIFYHDMSLDMLGALYNVPRHVFTPTTSFEDKKEEINYYMNTYPQFYNQLTEDDYHYQKRLEYYINNYNKKYFPELEVWKYYHVDSELINRKVIIAEQNYSYMRNLEAWENKYINELGKNKLESSYTNHEFSFEAVFNYNKPLSKTTISKELKDNSINGILIDENRNYVKDTDGNYVRIVYQYDIEEDNDGNVSYTKKYEEVPEYIEWFHSKEENNLYNITLTDFLRVVPNTPYQLRFCVKEYPKNGINLKIIYKNNNGDIREVEELSLEKKDYVEDNEYNELIYNNYNEEYGSKYDYLCNVFSTLSTAQNVELCLEAEYEFKISDITLQRIIVNHYDSEYMRTATDYNSCVYDLYLDYNDIPSNIRYENYSDFNKILNRALPISKKGFFNFIVENTNTIEDMRLNDETNIYIDDMFAIESRILPVQNHQDITDIHEDTGDYEYTYKFNKYVKKGEYQINIIPYDTYESNIASDCKIDIKMLVYKGNNVASWETTTINIGATEKGKDENGEDIDIPLYEIKDKNGIHYEIPFENKSNTKFFIRIYRDNSFSFKDFKLKRKSPLTMEEITR